MHGSLPPLTISGPDHPHAFDNIPERTRPPYADVRCTTCRGRGAWNQVLHLDSFRCILAICGDCDGSGWKSFDGSRTVHDIEMTEHGPAWTLRRIPPPPVLVAVTEIRPVPVGSEGDEILEAA